MYEYKNKESKQKNASADANRPSTAYQTKRYTVQNAQQNRLIKGLYQNKTSTRGSPSAKKRNETSF